METREIDVFLCKNMKHGFETFHTSDMSGEGSEYALIGTGKAVITMLSKEDVVKAQVDILREERTRMMADHQIQLEQIDERIQSLLAITHEASA